MPCRPAKCGDLDVVKLEDFNHSEKGGFLHNNYSASRPNVVP